ncbi:MAG TPA: amidase family protein, partial [Vicinamibacterales bacterium]|nr:amidase family protein [Vicinamibacterales bacterium]
MDLCFTNATDLARLIRTRTVSVREVMAAHLERIQHVNPRVNAIVAKLDDKQCLALADAADERTARREPLPPLHGLPIAFKDLQPAVGFPFTRGSPIFREDMPAADSVLVDRLRRAGAIPIGKTNVPEFGMGSHSYNPVYGTTRNPYDLTKSAGGSSGGAGAALAAGMLPIADGSDLGGSLRNPGNFNNVIGFRPSVGLVPTAPNPLPLLGFAVAGPMARTVADTAWLLGVMAGADPRVPGCCPSDPSVFHGALERTFRGTRVAWCPDLGALPLDRCVRAVLDAQRTTFEALGCIVEDAHPDLTDADSIFLTMRGFRTAAVLGPLLATDRNRLKPEAVEELESGLALTSADVARAMIQHGELLERVRRFQDTYEFIVCAVNQVPPFDAALDWPTSIEGVAMDHYVAWMKSAYWITVTFRPPSRCPPASPPKACQSASRSSGASATTSGRCSSRTRSSRRRVSARGV